MGASGFLHNRAFPLGENWLEFLRDMVRRGLGVPLSVTTDGAPGLMSAVEEMWPKSLRIRCWAHYAERRIMPSQILKGAREADLGRRASA